METCEFVRSRSTEKEEKTIVRSLVEEEIQRNSKEDNDVYQFSFQIKQARTSC